MAWAVRWTPFWWTKLTNVEADKAGRMVLKNLHHGLALSENGRGEKQAHHHEMAGHTSALILKA